MARIDNVENTSLLFAEQATAPTTPAVGFWRKYFKSDGLYVVDDAGVETGPLGASASATTAAVGAKVYRSGALSIASGVDTAIGWDAEEYDSDAFHDNATNNTRLTVPTGQAGLYLVTAEVLFADPLAAGTRVIVRLKKNGTELVGGRAEWSSGGASAELGGSVTAPASLIVGDYIEASVTQNSGSARNLRNTLGASALAITRLADNP